MAKSDAVVDHADFSHQVRKGKPYYSSKLQGQLLPDDWHFKHYLLVPKAGSKLIDAGTVLPNLTGPYLGKAPDLGALETGLGAPWTGPPGWAASVSSAAPPTARRPPTRT